MVFRLILLSAMLFLAGCAATGGTVAPEPEAAPEMPPAVEPAPSSAATIDEHLFEPEPVAVVHETVWDRVVHNFALPECSDHEVALNWAQWYADHPDYMARIFKRAQPWIYHIADRLEQRGMPGEIALLPIVESAYDPFAFSSGRALGAWQFIASTGRNYGLNQDWWYDGRRDVWASTDAALDYLQYMADSLFEGDWLLALAGYNSGENRVLKQVQRNRKAGKPADFWSLKLPKETRGYVPKLLGLACLFENPQDYDFTLPATPNEPVVAAVDLGEQADLVLVSQLAEVPIDVLFSLNPGYNRWATSPEGPSRVVLPVENAQRLEARLQDVDSATLMKWDQVVVQNGDTLSGISARHEVPVSILRSANDIRDDLIRPGQKLRLPRDNQSMVDPLYAQAAQELQRLQSGLIAAQRVTHRVRPGESLSVIARRYRVSVGDLQRWNNISDPRKLRAGRTITVFHSPAQPAAAQGGGTVKYVVQRGDSLWSIARKYDVRVKDLKSWNGLGGSTLHPGQSLRIVR